MKALLIDPHTKEISEIPDIDGARTTMARLIGCFCADAIGFCARHVAYVDDMGLFKPSSERAFFALPGIPPLVGKAVVLSLTDGGKTTNSSLSVEELSSIVTWLDTGTVRMLNDLGVFDNVIHVLTPNGIKLRRTRFRISFDDAVEG